MRALLGLTALAFAACSAPSASDTAAPTGPWSVDAANSRVSFVSVKADLIGEVHHFTDVSGSVSTDGAAQITIALDSVETLIDIRNERMREHLFETAQFPDAVISAQIDMVQFESLPVGQRMTYPLTAKVSLHGVDEEIDTDVYVTHLGDSRVEVQTRDPIVIDIDLFNFTDGVEKLRELASLDSITPVVPVTFSIVFEGAS